MMNYTLEIGGVYYATPSLEMARAADAAIVRDILEGERKLKKI